MLFAQQNQRQQGFTLLELLLVIVILAIVSAAVVITMNPDNTHRELEKEARRLNEVLRQLADESIFQGQEFGVAFKEDQYSFLIWDRETNQWQTYEQAPVFRSYTLPEPFVMLFEAEEIGFSLKKKKQSESLQEATDDDELELDPPNTWFLSSGEITPFTITMLADGGDERRYLITANEVGEITLTSPRSAGR